jgi:hypothetical protein
MGLDLSPIDDNVYYRCHLIHGLLRVISVTSLGWEQVRELSYLTGGLLHDLEREETGFDSSILIPHFVEGNAQYVLFDNMFALLKQLGLFKAGER